MGKAEKCTYISISSIHLSISISTCIYIFTYTESKENKYLLMCNEVAKVEDMKDKSRRKEAEGRRR
tara:strand:- start:1539 stop:1736 length:198 start_codon:yes stop_codon:yes gene_type:complete